MLNEIKISIIFSLVMMAIVILASGAVIVFFAVMGGMSSIYPDHVYEYETVQITERYISEGRYYFTINSTRLATIKVWANVYGLFKVDDIVEITWWEEYPNGWHLVAINGYE